VGKRGPDLLYPIGLRGEPTGEAVRATCWTTATRKLAQYQRRFGESYYLMQGIPYAANAHRYREVMGDPPKAATWEVIPRHVSAETMARQLRAQRHSGGE
jgi:hypothetical protein